MRADAASARSEGSPTAQRTWVQRGRGWRRPRGAVSQLGLLVSRALRCPPLSALGLPENGTWASTADLLGNLKKSEESGLLGSVCKVKGSAPQIQGLSRTLSPQGPRWDLPSWTSSSSGQLAS